VGAELVGGVTAGLGVGAMVTGGAVLEGAVVGAWVGTAVGALVVTGAAEGALDTLMAVSALDGQYPLVPANVAVIL